MTFDTLIINGTIVTENQVQEGEIAILNGKIAAIFPKGRRPAAEQIIDAGGNYIFPGAIDTHAHLNEPGYEWREDYAHGTRAAAVGGYTTVLDMPLQNEPALTTGELFQRKKELVAPSAYVDYCFWAGLVSGNGEYLKQLDEKGCVGFKAFIGPVSPDYESLDYGQVYEAMETIASFGGLAGFHCEDYSVIKRLEEKMKREGRMNWRGFLESRPEAAELIATLAVIELSKATGCKAHICHVSSPEAAQKIKEAKRDGCDITAETCAHYLCMTEEDVLMNGPLFKCAPPLRSRQQMERLWDYVADGTFDGIASDHSPCTYEEKFQAILGHEIESVFDVWGGISGIQSCFQTVFYEGCVKRGLSPTVLAGAMAARPARAFGLYGRKGDIQEGFDADLVIVDPKKPWRIDRESLEYVNKLSAFVGRKGVGLPVLTMVRGKVVAEDGQVVGTEGYGKLVLRHG